MEHLEKKIQNVIEIDPLKNIGLRYIGIGSENICFETKGSPTKLIKINLEELRRKIETLLSGREGENKDSHTHQKTSFQEQKKCEATIETIFGQDHLLKKGVFRSKVPLSKDIVLLVLESDPYNLAKHIDEHEPLEVEMLIQTQEKARELQDREKYHVQSFMSGVVTLNDFKVSASRKEALQKIRTIVEKGFLSEMDRCLREGTYTETLREITQKMILYTKQTGLMLDIFGPDNITLFVDTNGTPNYHLIDVILPGNQEHWAIRQEEDEGSLPLLRHCYTYYYSLKSLGDRFELTDNLIPEDLNYFKNTGLSDTHTS